MAEIQCEQDRSDMEYPPARPVAHEILKHNYFQRICPRAYTAAIPNTWISHQPVLRNDAFLVTFSLAIVFSIVEHMSYLIISA
ncbi:MAG: hypothetical protein WA610_08760 [Thermodesulfovibrionales bacterium]